MSRTPTVIVGGIGGSGTRLIAMILASLGLNIGNDLNEAYDNLTFTLLFKRQNILEISDNENGFKCAPLFIVRSYPCSLFGV